MSFRHRNTTACEHRTDKKNAKRTRKLSRIGADRRGSGVCRGEVFSERKGRIARSFLQTPGTGAPDRRGSPWIGLTEKKNKNVRKPDTSGKKSQATCCSHDLLRRTCSPCLKVIGEELFSAVSARHISKTFNESRLAGKKERIQHRKYGQTCLLTLFQENTLVNVSVAIFLYPVLLTCHMSLAKFNMRC